VKLSVVGLGKLGSCLAACLAAKGYQTIGLDVDPAAVDAIKNLRAPVVEPGLQELLEASGGRLHATLNYEEVVRETDVTFLVTPTPSEPSGHFTDRYLRSALEPLADALKTSPKQSHLFVITSTVSPGTTNRSLIPLIEDFSGRKLENGFGVCYSPEFIALGSVIRDFLNPDLVLIGETSTKAGDILAGIYGRVCENSPYVARMSVVSAEITKISLNAYVTMKISFANTLSNICEQIPGADVDAITSALGADKRISPYYIRGGLAYGGPCFPRDNRAFMAFASSFGCEARLAEATDEVNGHQVRHLEELVLKQLPDDRRVSILGLAYKTNTPVIEESAAVKLASALVAKGVAVTVYDPLAADSARAILGDRVDYASSVRECLRDSSCCVVTLPYDELKDLDDTLITHNPTTIIDCWRIVDPKRLGGKARLVALGKACPTDGP